jgi:hypothetical protein
MKTYAKLSIGLKPELKEYLSDEEFFYEATDILREAVQRALVSLDEVDLTDLPQEDFPESFIIRTDLKTTMLVRSLRKSERKKFYSLVNAIALKLVKEKLELRKKLENKIAQRGLGTTKQKRRKEVKNAPTEN